MDRQNKDSIYSTPLEKINNFVFDDKVVGVFNDMIKRSVPGYSAIITMLGYLAEEYVQNNSNCYDLGCSLGASTLSMRAAIDKENKEGVRIISVDNSMAMIEGCRENIINDTSTVPVDIICGDIADIDISNASVVVMNFTLQFFDPVKRAGLIKKIFDGMRDGGILVLSEKVFFENQQEEDFQTEMHHEFKRLNGYSDMEISQKRSALENVLISDSIEQHFERLKNAGFSRSHLWFQCFNFVSIVAVK